jgi:hypothetical protein
MKAELCACDGPECTAKAPVPHARVNPDGWWYVSGPHPHGRLDFCSIACLAKWSHPTVVHAATDDEITQLRNDSRYFQEQATRRAGIS